MMFVSILQHSQSNQVLDDVINQVEEQIAFLWVKNAIDYSILHVCKR